MTQIPVNPLRMPVEVFVDPSSKANTLPETSSIRQVLNKFMEGHGTVVLVGSDNKPKGIFTPSDLAKMRNAYRTGADARAIDIASKPVESTHSYSTLEDALTDMQRRGLKTGITVLDEEDRYAGYLYRGKVAKILGST